MGHAVRRLPLVLETKPSRSTLWPTLPFCPGLEKSSPVVNSARMNAQRRRIARRNLSTWASYIRANSALPPGHSHTNTVQRELTTRYGLIDQPSRFCWGAPSSIGGTVATERAQYCDLRNAATNGARPRQSLSAHASNVSAGRVWYLGVHRARCQGGSDVPRDFPAPTHRSRLQTRSVP